MSSYRVIRVGFDTIIIAVRAQLPKLLCEHLIDARDRAREKRSAEPVALGPGKIPGEVLPHGVQGGYDSVFSSGALGEMIQFKTDQKGDKWPIRLKIRAASFLAHGYPGAVDLALQRLAGIVPRIDEARLSEVHICVDTITDSGFRLDENRLVRPGRAVIRPYEILNDDHPLADEFTEPEVRRVLRGKRLQTLTVGSHATGSQAIIYNKRDEATLRKNWLLFEAYGLDRNDRSWALWRYEARFAGSVLKRKFRVRNFTDLNIRVREMLNWATTRLRYVSPGQDTVHPTRAAIDPLWQAIRSAVSMLSTEQPFMVLPSIAQKLLNQEKNGHAGTQCSWRNDCARSNDWSIGGENT